MSVVDLKEYSIRQQIIDEVDAWTQTLEHPSDFFNDLPSCPYAKKAWQDNKVRFTFIEKPTALQDSINNFDDRFELHILIDLNYTSSSNFHDYLDLHNDKVADGDYDTKDIWLMGFHPEDDYDDGNDESVFEQETDVNYALIFVQRLSKLHEAAEKLAKLGYYQGYVDNDVFDNLYEKRTNYYRRLKNAGK
jgi:hypothetical protein